MATVADEITLLPPEVLENIFSCSILGVSDLCNLRRTCSTFKGVLEGNTLWRVKFCQRWPWLYKEVEKRKLLAENAANISWKSITAQRAIVKQVVIRRLKEMAVNTHKKLIKYQKAMDESQFYNFCQLLPLEIEPDLQAVFIIDELRRILSRSHEWLNLTEKYYAEKSLWYFHHRCLQPEVEQFVATSLTEQDIEVGAVLIAQWFQPRLHFTVEDIKQELDSLAELTKQVLQTVSPSHPAITYKDTFVIDGKSLWSSEKCQQILHAIELVIKPNFNKGFDTYLTPTNSFINIVLSKKEGIPITLCLTVMSVARRLGLLLEPVNFPHHFILRWLEFPSKQGIERYSFIDVFGGRYSLTFENLVDSFSQQSSPITVAHCKACTHQDILHRMLRNLLNLGGNQRIDNRLDLLHHSVELSILFMPHDIELAVLSAQVSLHLKLNVPKALSRLQEAAGSQVAQNDDHISLQISCEELLQHLQRSQQEEETVSRQAKRRTINTQVQFAIGMVMKHKKYNYLCVIRGWDEKCQASEQWIQQMGVDRCERGRMQPFYNVWVMDGSDRYAAEENLIYTKDTVMIKHPEVGRLFEAFTGRYYIPGPQLLADYPDDLDVTSSMVSKFFEEQQLV